MKTNLILSCKLAFFSFFIVIKKNFELLKAQKTIPVRIQLKKMLKVIRPQTMKTFPPSPSKL